MIFITGDTHGDFDRIIDFCSRLETTLEDIIIVLGDCAINYYGGKKDKRLKSELSKLHVTIFNIHGNHEQRPQNIPTYKETYWHGGTVYIEQDYPNLLFAKDGEIYDLGNKKCIVIGGAYSVDKYYRLKNHWGWWPDEQPSDLIKASVERQLDRCHWEMDVVLTHTCPLKYEPRETFIQGIDQSTVDNSTEVWLDHIEENLHYSKWYCGHYHTSKSIDRMQFMFEDIKEFGQFPSV
jgi:3-oxoacid CoA-transferase subunit A